MDALSLLCTLHADGPTTLRLLRRAGCTTLLGVEAIATDELAGILDVAPAVARRLGREAQVLRERIDPCNADPEEAPPLAKSLTKMVQPRARRANAGAGAADTPSALGRRDQELVGAIVERWRERDTKEGRPSEQAPGGPGAPGRPGAQELDARTPAGIAAGAVDGLTEELALALAEAGIFTLAELAEGDGLALASVTGRPYAVLRRLQFLARRMVPAGVQRSAPVAPVGLVPSPAFERPAEEAKTDQKPETVIAWHFDDLVIPAPQTPGARPERDSDSAGSGGPFS